MKCFSSKNMNSVNGTLVVLVLCLNIGRFCFGEEDYSMSSDILAPMEREEQEALYKVVQGFVGKWWNGSYLYPDPCGWTPILVSTFLFFCF